MCKLNPLTSIKFFNVKWRGRSLREPPRRTPPDQDEANLNYAVSCVCRLIQTAGNYPFLNTKVCQVQPDPCEGYLIPAWAHPRQQGRDHPEYYMSCLPWLLSWTYNPLEVYIVKYWLCVYSLEWTDTWKLHWSMHFYRAWERDWKSYSFVQVHLHWRLTGTAERLTFSREITREAKRGLSFPNTLYGIKGVILLNTPLRSK